MKVITEQNLKYHKFVLDLENVYKEEQFIKNIKIIYDLIDEKIEDLL